MGQNQDPIRLMAPNSRFEQLPVETKQAIFSSLTDIASLRAAVLTCSSLYHAFKNAEDLITASVMLNEIDIDVLPEAFIAHASETWTQNTLFAAEHLQSRQPVSPKARFKISELIHLGKTAQYVNYFAKDFAEKALLEMVIAVRMGNQYQKFGDGPSSRVASREEMNRIKRALYMFEIHCNICSSLSQSQPVQAQFHGAPAAIFCRRFSPWENEQLASVYDYLFSIVAPVFNDIVEHDVAWGEYSVEFAENRDSGYIQYFLSLGLLKLYEIAIADSYESRYKLIYNKHPISRQFLCVSLERAYPLTIRPFDGHISHSYSIKSFFDDPNTGPMDAWSWAHEGEQNIHNLVFSKQRRWLREWGYVFWDRERLDEMLILELPWRKQWHSPTLKSFTYRSGKRRDLKESWERRQWIFMAGGRGWWSTDDESRVQWTKGWCPWDDEDMRKTCPFCIGEVRCTPHRLVLRTGGRARVILDVDSE